MHLKKIMNLMKCVCFVYEDHHLDLKEAVHEEHGSDSLKHFSNYKAVDLRNVRY